MQPVIGITTSFENGQQRLDAAYPLAVERSGGLPLLIPAVHERRSVEALLGKLDGILIPGGPAVSEGLLGPLPPDIAPPNTGRMRVDRWVLESALAKQLPILGICYGMQLVNAYFGGTIYADVEVQCSLPHAHSEHRGGTDHGLVLERGTWLHRILGDGDRTVNTRHIQALERVGHSLKISARAPDGVIEAIESEDGTFVGVQFHPERMGDQMRSLFDHLVSRSRIRREPAPDL